MLHTAPSGKTDYVVVGEAAGQSKLNNWEIELEKLLMRMDYLSWLGRNLKETGESQRDRRKEHKYKYKMQVQVLKVIVHIALQPANTTSKQASSLPSVAAPTTMDLWTVKWAPKKPEDLIGNHSIYEKLKGWLWEWKHESPSEFKAVLLSGPPGIGKTTMAHMACKEAGFDIVEMNASDTRNKKTLTMKSGIVINNSPCGFFEVPIRQRNII